MDVITDEGLSVGAAFPSASVLAARFGVSRPTVTKALNRRPPASSRVEDRAECGRSAPCRFERSVPSCPTSATPRASSPSGSC
ncbi:GntR family transcriptional regulator [Streptomyces sp. NPDC002763]|uniref:GntR family transcriptional regulator n=1 Tax=Streptomyces sp. NPDC002763 TaxID=3154427 RepID=UPI00332CCC9F